MSIICVETVTETKRDMRGWKNLEGKSRGVPGFFTLESSSGEDGGPVLFGTEATIDGWTWPFLHLFSRMQLLIIGLGPGLK